MHSNPHLQNPDCSYDPPTPKQRRYLITLTQRRETSLLETDLCCTKHAGEKIASLRKGSRRRKR